MNLAQPEKETIPAAPNRPKAPGRWQVTIHGRPAIINVIDIDESRERLFAVDEHRNVRSLDWWEQTGEVKWIKPSPFDPVGPIPYLTEVGQWSEHLEEMGGPPKAFVDETGTVKLVARFGGLYMTHGCIEYEDRDLDEFWKKLVEDGCYPEPDNTRLRQKFNLPA